MDNTNIPANADNKLDDMLALADQAQRRINGIVLCQVTDIRDVDTMYAKIEYNKKNKLDVSVPFNRDGYTAWFNNDKQLDKKDGPAVVNFKGRDFWFKNDKPYIPEGKQIVQYSDEHFREYDNGVLVKDTGVIAKASLEEEAKNKKVNEQHTIVEDVVNKFRKLFSSDENKNKPKM